MKALAALWKVLYPVRCGGCGTLGPDRLCARCLAAWPAAPTAACDGCALPREPGRHACVATPGGFDGVRAAATHAGVARRAVHALKYRGQRGLARPLARKLHLAIGRPPDDAPWLVVPIPLHPARRRHRGYDQAALLARALAREAGWEYLDALGRVRETSASPGLTRDARLANMADAFACRRPVRGRRVLLVDDVLTTGATADAAARALRTGGAREIVVAVVARAL